MTRASTPIASTVSTVSRSDSPLDTEEPLAATLMASADSHLPAISNDDRVRVESSKNRLTTVRPRRAGSFLTVAALHVVHLGRGREQHAAISSAGEVGDGEQVLHRASRLRRWSRRPRSVDLGEAHADALRVRRWAGSCRRGRPGSAARGGRGRRARPVGRRAGGRGRPARRARPGRCGRSRARRRRARRPCRRCPRRDRGVHGARVGWWRRSSRYIVMSRLPIGSSAPSTSAIGATRRSASGDAAGGDAEQDQVVGAVVALEDLVRDAAQGPGHVTGGEDGATGRVEGVPGGHGGVGARHERGPPSLPHGTGR